MRPAQSLLLALALTAMPAAAADKISPALAGAFAGAPDGRAEMLVVMAEQADLSPAQGIEGKEARGRFVFERLTATAERSQAPLLAELARRGVPHRPFWAANFVWVEGDLALARALAARPDVTRLDANPRLVLPAPVVDPEDLLRAAAAPEAIEWNLTKVNAPQVWAMGHTGQGAVIAGQDTGYQWDHPALKSKYRGWNGTTADHNYNWHDAIHAGGGSCGPDSPAPCDDDSHGTHTMGTMVGDDGSANQIGMAPGARWIGCRNMNVGVGSPTTYIECFQWFLAPTDLSGQNPDPSKAPDVINNSWGCPPDEGCDLSNFAVMQQVVENLRAAGIVVVVSAGNDGAACSTVNTPAAIYDAAFSVGSTTSSDTASSFSSRGPVTVDGSNRMKPDIAAPGSGVRSSIPGGGYTPMSGTSMAGPHVAGLVGLMVSAVPAVAGDVDRIEDLIRQSAFHPTFSGECGVAGGVFPNNTFGAGRIDALAAVNLVLALADFRVSVSPESRSVCAPANASFDVGVGQLGSFAEPITLAATGNPAGSSVGFGANPVTPAGATTMDVSTAGVAAGTATITVTGTASPSGTVRSDTVTLSVFTVGAGQPALTAPANGALNVAVRPTFTWGAAAQASTYRLEVSASAGFGVLLVDQSGITGTSFTPAADLPGNTVLYWRVTATNPCGTGSASSVFSFGTVALPGDCGIGTAPQSLFSEDFAGGLGSWTSSGTGNTWAISTTRVHSAPNSLLAVDVATVSDQRLVSPALAMPASVAGLTLQFWNHQTIESSSSGCYDGAILEYTTNAGSTWTQVPGAALLTDPYNGTVSTCCSNPLAGLPAWCGNPQDWLNSVVDLSGLPIAGQTVQFRFRLGTDSSAAREGWYLDDVKVRACVTGTVFTEGFESGGLAAWSAKLP